MAAIINLIPQGLLDLFSIRSGGRNPQQLAEQLLPTLDMQRWYQEAKVLEVDFAVPQLVASADSGVIDIPVTTPTNLSNGTSVNVPENEVWMVLPGTCVRWQFSIGAGTSGRFGLQTRKAGTVQMRWPMRAQGYDASSATIQYDGSMTMDLPYWIQSGGRIQVVSHGVVVAATESITVSGSLRVVRMRV